MDCSPPGSSVHGILQARILEWVAIMFSKSFLQFSVGGWGCVPSLLFTWDQTMAEVMKIIVTSFKRSHACTATLSALSPAAGHHQPMPPLETPGHSQASLGQSLVGSLFLSSGSRCTGPGHLLDISTVGLMVTSSKRAYAIPCLVHPESLSLWQTTADLYLHRRPSNTRGEQRHFAGLAVSRYPMNLLTAAPAPTILLGCLSPWTLGISLRPVQ